MPVKNHVENPLEYLIERFSWAASDIRRAANAPPHEQAAARPYEIRRIQAADLGASLREGLRDLGVARSDVVFLALIYPVVGLVLARLAFSLNLLPMILPLVAGFALLGPLAAIGLYEVSRRLERGEEVSWSTPLKVLQSPALGSIAGLGGVLALIFFAWMATAWGVYAVTLGPEAPTSLSSFLNDVFTTPQGWTMIIVGVGLGAVFAALAFAISAISFPLLLDRNVGMGAAIQASLKAVATNPGVMAFWGAIIAGSLILGSIPALAGLMLVMPLFGHASWRLYRKVVADA